MAKYTAPGGNSALSTSYKTALELVGGTGVRPKLHTLQLVCTSPADDVMTFLLQRLSATGTGTSVTPAPVDSADPASECTCKSNDSGEPTYSGLAKLFGDLDQHTRGPVLWQAWDDESRFVVPASSGAGLGLQVKHASRTPATTCEFGWDE